MSLNQEWRNYQTAARSLCGSNSVGMKFCVWHGIYLEYLISCLLKDGTQNSLQNNLKQHQ